MEIQSTNSRDNTNLETTKPGSRSVELLCPKCKQRIPSIEEILISSKKAAMVRLNCQCLVSNKMETVELGEYLHFLSLIDHNQFVCFKHTERIASVFCKNCSLYLCSECRSYHMAFTPNHVTFVLEEKTENQYCFTHSTCLLDLYCEDCNDNVCIECARRFHFSHKVMKLKEYWGRVNNKFANKTHEEITAFMNSQITSLESFIQIEVERISSMIFTLQQLKTKLEHKVKHAIKTNKTIGLLISCIFSDFFKGEFCPNFMIIQNIERIMFEELLSLEEKNIILQQFSAIEKSINALFHLDKDCLNRTIAKVIPKRNTMKVLSNIKIMKSASLQSVQPIQSMSQLQQPFISTLQVQQSIPTISQQSMPQIPQAIQQSIPSIQQSMQQSMQQFIQQSMQQSMHQSLQPTQSLQQLQCTQPILPLATNNQLLSSFHWTNKEIRDELIQTPISLQLPKGELGKKTINKEEVLKQFNLGFNNDMNSHMSHDLIPQDHKMLLHNKKKRGPIRAIESNLNDNQNRQDYFNKERNSLIKVSMKPQTLAKVQTPQTSSNIEYFKIGKERKPTNNQLSFVKRLEKEKELEKEKTKERKKEKIKPLNNTSTKYEPQKQLKSDNSFFTLKQEVVKTTSHILFECTQSVSKQSKKESPEKENKLITESMPKEGNEELLKENKFFSNQYDDNSRENEFNFFHKGFEEYSPILESNNIFSEFKCHVLNNQFEQCVTTITEHKSSVKMISQLNNGFLISAGNDNVVNIYNNENGFECTSKISTSDNEIYCLLELFDGNIAIGLNDNSIKIYDISSTTCCMVLIGHSKPVTFMFQKEIEILLSCSDDCNIKMWDLNTKNCLFTYNEHIDGVTGLLKLNDEIMLSVSKDTTLKQWKYLETKSIYSIKTHAASVTMIIKLFDENQIATSSADKTIKVWDIEQKTCLGTFRGHTDQVSGIIQLTDGTLASVSYDTTMRIWDVRSFSCINSIIISSKRVNVLYQLSNGSIATGAEDSFIKIWV